MITHIKSVHEEAYSDGRTVGVLYNYSNENHTWKESFIYIYKAGSYIFFDTIVDMINYQLYGEKKMKRAYMTEEEFDEIFDAPSIDGKFSDKLTWMKD